MTITPQRYVCFFTNDQLKLLVFKISRTTCFNCTFMYVRQIHACLFLYLDMPLQVYFYLWMHLIIYVKKQYIRLLVSNTCFFSKYLHEKILDEQEWLIWTSSICTLLMYICISNKPLLRSIYWYWGS
jgi:hypothetical protein